MAQNIFTFILFLVYCVKKRNNRCYSQHKGSVREQSKSRGSDSREDIISDHQANGHEYPAYELLTCYHQPSSQCALSDNKEQSHVEHLGFSKSTSSPKPSAIENIYSIPLKVVNIVDEDRKREGAGAEGTYEDVGVPFGQVTFEKTPFLKNH